jgi:uncharacterized protein (DUF488 family)
MVVYTVGHSNRSFDDFLDLLRANGIERIVDARRIPRSAHNPQFNTDVLAKSLQEHDIEYRHVEALGGLRKQRPDSRNAAWKNASFRGYADYMETEEFRVAFNELLAFASEKPTAIMCAEAVPWRCHRSLIADALVAAGSEVRDITGPGIAREHKLPPFATVSNARVTYPGDASLF